MRTGDLDEAPAPGVVGFPPAFAGAFVAIVLLFLFFEATSKKNLNKRKLQCNGNYV
jgi:hypothetical protein